MNIFITGSRGFVGRYFVDEAVSRGHKILSLTRNNNDCKLSNIANKYIQGSLSDITPGMLQDVDVVVHLAAIGVSPRIATPIAMVRNNAEETLSLIVKANEAKVRRVVIAGSFSEYGLSANDYESIPPNAKLLPVTFYGASKAAAFSLAYAAAIELGIELIYLRLFSVYGEGQYEQNFWPSLKAAALAGRDFKMSQGTQVRDFVPVECVAKKILSYACIPSFSIQTPIIENIGTGQGVSLKEFAESWWRHFSAKGKLEVGALPFRENEIMRYVPVISKIEDKYL